MVAGVFSFLLGAVAVLQAGLNRHIMKSWGLASAILLNSLILLVIAGAFWFVSYKFPAYFPAMIPPKMEAAWKWWWIIPGFCGFSLVAGIPAAIPKLGAAGVFLCIVVGQMTFSLLWDMKVEQIPLDPKRLLGVFLALAGLFLSWKS